MAEATQNSTGLLHVRLVTPDRILLDATADAVELPATCGYLEALYGAAPLLAELGAGEVRLHGGASGGQVFFVASGFVEVLPERVTILAETALHPDEIDPAEAQADAFIPKPFRGKDLLELVQKVLQDDRPVPWVTAQP